MSQMKYYVYQLVDSITGKVFYIGKGQGNRMYQHTKEARKPGNSYKLNKIRKIWREGGQVICRKVGLFASESRAYEYESMLIRDMPDLTNACRANNIIPKDTHMGRRMYAAELVASYWPETGRYLILKLLQEGANIMTLRRQQAYMDKTYGI